MKNAGRKKKTYSGWRVLLCHYLTWESHIPRHLKSQLPPVSNEGTQQGSIYSHYQWALVCMLIFWDGDILTLLPLNPHCYENCHLSTALSSAPFITYKWCLSYRWGTNSEAKHTVLGHSQQSTEGRTSDPQSFILYHTYVSKLERRQPQRHKVGSQGTQWVFNKYNASFGDLSELKDWWQGVFIVKQTYYKVQCKSYIKF
jgi:hypothetical protein